MFAHSARLVSLRAASGTPRVAVSGRASAPGRTSSRSVSMSADHHPPSSLAVGFHRARTRCGLATAHDGARRPQGPAEADGVRGVGAARRPRHEP